MKKILIVNDDGIEADGIIRLAKNAIKYGEVWVVAPESQRSAMSHSVTLRHPIEAWKYDFEIPGVHAYACDGTPADCARIGILNIVPGKPDYVFSGINYGYNSATDIQYSATAGAALEASFQGIHTIAFSEEANALHEGTDRYLDEIMGKLLEVHPGENRIWNVNFPATGVKGVLYDRKVSSDLYYSDEYRETLLPNGHISYMVNGTIQNKAEEGTDLRAIFDGYVSVGIVNNIN